MMSKDQWFAELERIADDFTADGDEQKARDRLRRLGMTDVEIEEYIAEWKA